MEKGTHAPDGGGMPASNCILVVNNNIYQLIAFSSQYKRITIHFRVIGNV